MAEHTFDAQITVDFDPELGERDPGKQGAADLILDYANDYGLAISLFDSGSLNVKELTSKLPSWVSADNPPFGRCRVLGFWPVNANTLGGAIDTVFYAPNAENPWGGHGNTPPTHWMPLPEPPK